jgi:hypothetical protein
MTWNTDIKYLRSTFKHEIHSSTYSFATTTFGLARLAGTTRMVKDQGEKNFHKVEKLTRIIKTADLIDEEIYSGWKRGQKILAGLILSMLVGAGHFPLVPHFQPNGKYRSGYRLATHKEMGKAA